ncbi:MAG TPA: hypothetical protein VLA37_00555 [Sphingomonadaceae bacterium]|nr:hypothetical protein [Sphingomonadaceae bacterium]
MPFLVLLPLIAQAAAPEFAEPMNDEASRLFVCLEQARTDASSAILTASQWLGESSGAERAFPQQCLGVAYTRLLRWQAAEEAFLTAHDLALADDYAFRAKLAAMAGNAAIAQDQNIGALADFDIALADAARANDTKLAGDIQVDRARALVALGELAEAETALGLARRDSPQNAEGWLLSATLSRRLGQLDRAQAQIVTAAGLDPLNPAIGLEAGLIAVLSDRDEAALKSWRSVVEIAPDAPEAQTARDYIAQLEGDQG